MQYEKGEVSQKFINKLNQLYETGGMVASMGYHDCPFCKDGKSSSEKTLFDKENKISYIFPKMIFHYIEKHNFKPSDEFMNFVLQC